MNCTEIRKYLYAFADGELDTPENLDVLEHLNMCTTCTQKVNVQQQLKVHVARVMSAAPSDAAAPESLRASIASMIANEAGATAVHPQGHHVRLGGWRYWIPGAVAAAIALAMAGVWSFDRNDPTPALITNAQPAVYDYTDHSENAVLLANHVYDEHLHGCDPTVAHHDSSLPRETAAAARELSQRLGCPMLRCDNLPGMPDASFASANICTLIDVKGNPVKGGHIVLTCSRGQHVSLISVPRLAEMKDLGKLPLGKREYAVLKPDNKHTRGQSATVVAFDCPKASHFVCAPCEPDQAMRLAEPLRMAIQNIQPPPLQHPGQHAPYMLASLPPAPQAQ